VIKSKLLCSLATLPLAFATIATTSGNAQAISFGGIKNGSTLGLTGVVHLPDFQTISFCPDSLTGLGCAAPVDSFFPGSNVADALVANSGNRGSFVAYNNPNAVPFKDPDTGEIIYVRNASYLARVRSLELGNTKQFNRFLQIAAVKPITEGTAVENKTIPLLNFNLTSLNVGALEETENFLRFAVSGTGNFITWEDGGKMFKTTGEFDFTAQFPKDVFEDVFGDVNGDGEFDSSHSSTFSVALRAVGNPTSVPEPMTMGGAAVAAGALGWLKRKRAQKLST
jgi:hypothetical protein